jgi:phenylacetate-CoA ligase
MNSSLSRALYRSAQRLRGERVFQVLRELEASQRWSADRLRDLQWSRQQALAHHAFETVPLYRKRWSAAGFSPGDLKSPVDWARLPVLEKRDLQEAGSELLSRDAPPGVKATTSGSSGTPVAVLRGHASWSHAHANVFRGWRWHGLDVGDPYAYFWGLALDESGQRQAALRDWFFNRRRYSAFETRPERAAQFHRDLVRSPARFAFGYPSAVMQFADQVVEQKLDGRALRWRAVITTAEMLKPHQREVLAETFGCRVVDSYGCAETGVAGFECEHGGMHVPVESTVVDLIPDGDGASQILLTDLHNFSEPVIRYRIGDLVEPAAAACPCGRSLPLLGRLQGRTGDTITLPDGRRVNALLPYYLFRPYAKTGTVRSYQLAEYPGGRIELRVQPGSGWDESLESKIEREVSDGLGVQVRVVRVSGFAPGGRGKHRDYVRVQEGEDPERPGGS